MVEPGIRVLAAMGPVGEGVVALGPVIIFHVAAAPEGHATLCPHTEAVAELGIDAATQHRRSALPDQVAERVVADQHLLISAQIDHAKTGFGAHAVVGADIGE